jgi:hypothetical protein
MRTSGTVSCQSMDFVGLHISCVSSRRTRLAQHRPGTGLRKGILQKSAFSGRWGRQAGSPEEAIKDPDVLEFLDLKDEYSEDDLEEALIHRLEDFLPELWAETSHSSDGNDGCASVTAGFAWTCYFSTSGCAVW